MIKKIKVEVQEERKKRTYKNSVEVKAGSMSQEGMKHLAKEIREVLIEYGLIDDDEEGEE